MFELSGRNRVVARALGFTILTAARSGETRGMTWAEVDLGTRLWTIPAHRMETSKEHRFPLNDAAPAYIGPHRERRILVFESEAKPAKPISDMSMIAVVQCIRRRSMPLDRIDKCAAQGVRPMPPGFPREVIEAALAHGIHNKAEAACARGDLFAKRRDLMDAWGSVVPRTDLGATVVRLSDRPRR